MVNQKFLSVIAFLKNERTYPNFILQAQEIKIFRKDSRLATPLGFFRGFGLRFHVHRLKSARPAKDT